jgi:hypothetical protein
MTTKFIRHDGGRAEAGFRGTTRDCVVRAFAIALERPYLEIYNDFSKRMGKGNSPRDGVPKPIIRKFAEDRGLVWTATMSIGTGCKVHLKADELPNGRIVCSVSRHLVAVVDGVVYDTYDSMRNETRCVYGYWSKPIPTNRCQ